jgi:branched-chain amino acid transport system ATP-binding protein
LAIPNRPILEVQNLVSGYGKLAIVQDFSLTVDVGEFIAIIGPNGSGKSTLVKSIFGLTTIFEGKIIFEGVNITSQKPEEIARRGLGYVPQVSNVFADMTVRENLELGAIPRSKSNGDQEMKVLERVLGLFPDLSQKSSSKANSLSGGQRQMLAVARVLMAEPKAMILDEASAGVAPIVAELLFQKLVEMHRLGLTLILVEQNARKALSIAERGVVLVQGRKAFEGSPEQISQDKEIAKLFLGEAPNP